MNIYERQLSERVEQLETAIKSICVELARLSVRIVNLEPVEVSTEKPKKKKAKE